MVRDIELPFNYHKVMSRRRFQFLLYLLVKQNGDRKPKWWPNNIQFQQPMEISLNVSKDTLTTVFKSYYKMNGDSDWLRAILYFTNNLQNLTNETDFSTIDISGKISHYNVDYDIVPSRKYAVQNGAVKPVSRIVNRKRVYSILSGSTEFQENKYNDNFENTGIKDKKILKINDKVGTDKDIKLYMKESHIKKLIPAASVQLLDVVKYNTVQTKENFLMALNLMKTDVFTKLNCLKFRRRLRNNGGASIRSAFEDLTKFRSKINKDVPKVNKSSRPQSNRKEITVDTTSFSTATNGTSDKIDSTDTNKENEHIENDSKENSVIDLTMDDIPTVVKKGCEIMHQFLNVSPTLTPKSKSNLKQSSPNNLKRVKQHSLPLSNKKDIRSYFKPIPMRLSSEFIAKKLEELKSQCRPCFVKLDLVKDLKPIRSNSIKIVKKKSIPLPVSDTDEDDCDSVIDLTSDDENVFEPIININEEKANHVEMNDRKLNRNSGTKEKVEEQRPKKTLNNNNSNKKLVIEVKWPSKICNF